jgi:Tol biopolymer transport system component
MFLAIGGIGIFTSHFRKQEVRIVQAAQDRANALEWRVSDSQGRFVAFQSSAVHFGVLDMNDRIDIYVQDRQTGEFFLVSTDSSGNQGNGDSIEPSISSDGRYVAFRSIATNFLPGDSNLCIDIFVKDLKTGALICASTNCDGKFANGPSGKPTISSDGRYVTFRSSATNLVPDDTNPNPDIYTKDLLTQSITRSCVPLELSARAAGRADRRGVASRR